MRRVASFCQQTYVALEGSSAPVARLSSRAMFQISRLEDANVKILPENLGKPRLEAITQVIESLYIDKVGTFSVKTNLTISCCGGGDNGEKLSSLL